MSNKKHKPVPLPLAIGKEWDKLLIKHSSNFDDVLEQVINHETSDDLLDWWWDRKDENESPSLILADAYRYGWETQEKRYLLPMTGTETNQGLILYAYHPKKKWEVFLFTEDWPSLDYTKIKEMMVTESQLSHAPAWVKAIEREEVDL